MRVKEKWKFRRGGGGGLHKPSGMEILSEWRIKTRKPSMGVGGGMDIFWNYTMLAARTVEKKSLE